MEQFKCTRSVSIVKPGNYDCEVQRAAKL